ncbi:hypothetical protein Nepgr_016291 [Nepenthes gracilis]|uniref:Uncharacterized protein n=1 Tax=Nepenthes gracilis TaxID=150966 RepID=A0AAD3SMG2_NEPGR|nr:hypothetical protein Nepgr_016291 [Nepenthes gracilis]
MRSNERPIIKGRCVAFKLDARLVRSKITTEKMTPKRKWNLNFRSSSGISMADLQNDRGNERKEEKKAAYLHFLRRYCPVQ